MPINKKVLVIGSGFAGLSAATHLAHMGYQVTLLEKNNTPGGDSDRGYLAATLGELG